MNTTGSLFGESNHTEKIHNINKYEVYSLNYDQQVSDDALVILSAMKRKFDNVEDQDYYFINYIIKYYTNLNDPCKDISLIRSLSQ